MIIDKLSDSAVKIRLDRDDFQKYNIDCSDVNINSIRKFLINISEEISEVLETDITASRLFVEVFSQKNKCVIFVSAMSCKYDNKIIKKHSGKLICQFEDFGTLESFCYALTALYKNSISNSCLFCSTNKLRLVLTLSDEYENIRYFASGYCYVIPADEVNTAVTDEYYKRITPQNAVEEILLSIRQ